MVSRSHHWLRQFQLVTEHSLKDATNYGNRATGVGTKHAVFRSRDRDRDLDKMNSSALESRDHGRSFDHGLQGRRLGVTIGVAPKNFFTSPQSWNFGGTPGFDRYRADLN